MFDTLFGADVPLAVKFFLAFVIVLGLIGGTAWAVRRFGADRLGGGAARGRQPRLAVVDAATVDSRRRLVIIRRDNVEHLLMIGGPTDVVVETNIVRGGAQRDVHGTQPSRAVGDTLPRPVPLAEGSMWPLQPEPMPRPQRPAPPPVEPPVHWPLPTPPEPARQQQRPAEPRPADTLAGLADELSSQPPPAREPPPAPRLEPARMTAAQPFPAETATAPSEGDENLAEMAQRLEAALRKPGQAAVARSAPAARPAAAPAPEQRSTRASARMRAATAPAPAPAAVAPEPAHAAAAPEPVQPDATETKPAREEPKGDNKGGKTLYESLEQEMASLLGRPQDKG